MTAISRICRAPQEQLARLKNYIMDVFDAFPDQAPGWKREWRELHPGGRP